MKGFEKILPGIIGAIACTTVFADNYFYCNNNYIYLGETLERAQQVCGKPLSIKKSEVTPEVASKVTRFIYHHNPGTLAALQPYQKAPYGLIVDVTDEKIVSIRVLGEDVRETDYCRVDKLLKVGDSVRMLYQLCYLPDEKHENFVRRVKQKPVKQTIITYQDNQYLPPVKLKFYDDKLVSVER